MSPVLFVTGALRDLHARGMRYAQRQLDAKSFCHYANDAYSPYEILYVIGSGQDHFLPSKDRRQGSARGRGRETKDGESSEKNGEMKESRQDTRRESHTTFIVLCFRENIFLIFSLFSKRVLEEQSKGWRDRKGRKERQRKSVGEKGRSKDERRGKIYAEGGRVRRARVPFFKENMFFICELLQEMVIITNYESKQTG